MGTCDAINGKITLNGTTPQLFVYDGPVNSNFGEMVFDNPTSVQVSGTGDITCAKHHTKSGHVTLMKRTMAQQSFIVDEGSIVGVPSTGEVSVGGDMTINGQYDGEPGKLILNGFSPQLIDNSPGVSDPASNFGEVNFSSSATVTVSGTSPFVLEKGAVYSGAAHILKGITRYGGSQFTVQSGGTLVIPSTGEFSFAGGLIVHGLCEAEGGKITFNGTTTQNFVFHGNPASNFGELIFDNPTSVQVTGSGDITCEKKHTKSGHVTLMKRVAVQQTLTVDAGATIEIPSTGELSVSGDITYIGTCDAIDGKITLNGSTPQVFTYDGPSASNFGELTFDNYSTVEVTGSGDITCVKKHTKSGHVTLLKRTAVQQACTIDAGATLEINGAVSLEVGGDWINNGLFVPGTLSVVLLNGTVEQHISGSTVTSFSTLEINTTTPVVLQQNCKLLKEIKYARMKGETSVPFGVILSPDCIVTGADDSHYINAKVTWEVDATGPVIRSFPIGDDNYYAPLDVSLADVTMAGSLTASTIPTFLPGSMLDITKKVNRHWIITNSGLGFTPSPDNMVTLKWFPADLDASTNIDDLIVAKHDGGTWSYPTVVSPPVDNSIQVSSINDFSDFQVGELNTGYCTNLYVPGYDCIYGGSIEDFHFNDISQTATGCSANGYVDYTSITGHLAQGETYNFSYTSNSAASSGSDYIGIWIDFNDDLVFDATENIYLTAAGQHSGLVTIPETASLGAHRMRVRSVFYYGLSANDACTLYYYGETHDYSVDISGPAACPNVSGMSVSLITKYDATVSWNCAACPEPFIVEYGPVGFTPGTGALAGIGGTAIPVSASSVDLHGLSHTTNYEVYIRRECTGGLYSTNSGPITFTTLYDACSSLTSIVCGTPVHSVHPAGLGEYYTGICDSDGRENIFSFTPTVTGTYTLSTSASSTGYMNYSYKVAAACDGTGWTCLDIHTGNDYFIIGNLAAGTTYYLMLDAYSGGDGDHTFVIDCYTPYEPCLNPISIDCGTIVSALLPSGLGAFSNTTCEFYNNMGKELIYEFTPGATGIYTIDISNTNFQTFGVTYKKASLGCNQNGWNCILETSNSGTHVLGTLVAGTSYYIMIDAFSLHGATLDFKINCYTPYDPCDIIYSIPCDTDLNFQMPAGVGHFNLSACGLPANIPVGTEQILSFTPSQTGPSALFQSYSPWQFGHAKFYMKTSESSTAICDSEGWTCLGEFNGNDILPIPGGMTLGVVYYIMADATEISGAYQTVQIVCPGPVYEPCTGSYPAIACASPLTGNIPAGIGAYNFACNGSSITQGKELIYTFTPTVSGTHKIDLSNDNFYGAKYFIKDASGGCNVMDWVCIGMSSYYGVTYYRTLEAGHTYFIMMDGVKLTGSNETIEITCPSLADPCSNIQTVTCGSTGIVNISSGLGRFTPPANEFTYPGRENIFMFTPTVSGNHGIDIFATGSPTEAVQYFVKPASGGCNNTGWTPFANVYYGGNYTFPYGLVAGDSYLIMADGADPTQTAEHSFSIVCPETEYDPCSDIEIITGCGIPVTSFNPAGYGLIAVPNSCSIYPDAGTEKIFLFTPGVSGNYGVTFNFSVNIYAKPAGSCDGIGWTCMSNTPYHMNAATAYLIMTDAPYISGASGTFQIDCMQPDICPAIATMTCGTSNYHLSLPQGWGNESNTDCNGSSVQYYGSETVYAFTASMSGIHHFYASNINTGSLIIKVDSVGCNSNNYLCVGSTYFQTYIDGDFPYPLIAGHTYYIKFQGQNKYGTEFDFNISCPSGCELYADVDGDGYGDPNNIVYSCFPVYGYTIDNSDCDDTNVDIHICGGLATLELQLILQGFYSGSNTMRANKFDLGLSADPTEADDITVSLWSVASLLNEVPDYSLSTVLHTNGMATIEFPAEVNGNSWYIAVKHRNHIETWSKFPVLFSSTTSYNFSNELSQAFDDGVNAPMALMAEGEYAFYGGDINQDGGIDASDLGQTFNEANTFEFGYIATDVTGDGGPDASDLALIYNNSQLFLFYARPYE